MGRLVAFDQQTASAISARARRAPHRGHGDALKAALSSEDQSLLLLPSSSPDQVLLAEMRRTPTHIAQPTSVELRDSLVHGNARPEAQGLSASSAPTSATDAITAAPNLSPMGQHIAPSTAEEPAYEATGFLGLHDSPVYEEEALPKPKRWWHRFWS